MSEFVVNYHFRKKDLRQVIAVVGPTLEDAEPQHLSALLWFAPTKERSRDARATL